MNTFLKVLLVLAGLLFIVIGLRWLVAPASVAAEFGMPLLDGLGRSTQIGDIGAFFVSGGAMALLGVITWKRIWFLAPALMLSLTAVFRVVAWLVHDAAFAQQQIAVEVVLTVLMLVAASKADKA